MHQSGGPPSNVAPNNVSMGLLGRSLPPMLMNNIPNSVGVLSLTNGPPPFRSERGADTNDLAAFNPKRVKLSHNENFNYNDIVSQHQNSFPSIPFNKINNYLINNNNSLKHKGDVIDSYPGINLINFNLLNNNIKLFQNHNIINNNLVNNPPTTLNNNTKPPLHINTEIKKESAYTLQVEAISPTPPSDQCNDDDIKLHKEDILNHINRVDREIAHLEQNLVKLHKKKDQLEEGQSKTPKHPMSYSPRSSGTPSDHSTSTPKQQSISQIVLTENQTKALQSHDFLRKLNLKPRFNDIPLYSHVTETEVYKSNIQNFITFKPKLIAYLKRRKQYESARRQVLSKRYKGLLELWNRKVDKAENNAKKRLNDAKMRDVFEKAFPELKRKREDKERTTRLTTTGNAARNCSNNTKQEPEPEPDPEQLEMDKRRENAAVVPDLLSEVERRKKWINENGNLENDLNLVHMFSMVNRVNYWTHDEKDLFKNKFISHPKSFASIASFLPTKSLNDCVLYYYGSKKSTNYKQLLRRHHMSRRKTDKAKKAQANKEVKEDKVEEAEEAKPAIITPAIPVSTFLAPSCVEVDASVILSTSTASLLPTSLTSVSAPLNISNNFSSAPDLKATTNFHRTPSSTSFASSPSSFTSSISVAPTSNPVYTPSDIVASTSTIITSGNNCIMPNNKSNVALPFQTSFSFPSISHATSQLPFCSSPFQPLSQSPSLSSLYNPVCSSQLVPSSSSSSSSSKHVGGSIVLGTPLIMSQQQSGQDYRESFIKDSNPVNNNNFKSEYNNNNNRSSPLRNVIEHRNNSPIVTASNNDSKDLQSKEILQHDFLMAQKMHNQQILQHQQYMQLQLQHYYNNLQPPIFDNNHLNKDFNNKPQNDNQNTYSTSTPSTFNSNPHGTNSVDGVVTSQAYCNNNTDITSISNDRTIIDSVKTMHKK